MRGPLAGVLLCVILSGGIGCSAPPAPTGPPSRGAFLAPAVALPGVAVVLGHARDRTGSRTAEHWVSSAEHVAAITVISETRGQASANELKRREGMIGRQVEIRIDRVLWSAAKAFPASPTTVRLEVAGWVFNDNSGVGEQRFALEDSSRLEPGHGYVMALDWVDDPCTDNPAKGQWALLGSGGTIPFDGGELGSGEFEGSVYTASQAREAWQQKDSAVAGLRDQVVGSTAETLVTRLKAATPRPSGTADSMTCDKSEPS